MFASLESSEEFGFELGGGVAHRISYFGFADRGRVHLELVVGGAVFELIKFLIIFCFFQS